MPEEIDKPALTKREFFALEAMKVLVSTGAKDHKLGVLAGYSVYLADRLIFELTKDPETH